MSAHNTRFNFTDLAGFRTDRIVNSYQTLSMKTLNWLIPSVPEKYSILLLPSYFQDTCQNNPRHFISKQNVVTQLCQSHSESHTLVV